MREDRTKPEHQIRTPAPRVPASHKSLAFEGPAFGVRLAAGRGWVAAPISVVRRRPGRPPGRGRKAIGRRAPADAAI
jgi:hypothetical protein